DGAAAALLREGAHAERGAQQEQRDREEHRVLAEVGGQGTCVERQVRHLHEVHDDAVEHAALEEQEGREQEPRQRGDPQAQHLAAIDGEQAPHEALPPVASRSPSGAAGNVKLRNTSSSAARRGPARRTPKPAFTRARTQSSIWPSTSAPEVAAAVVSGSVGGASKRTSSSTSSVVGAEGAAASRGAPRFTERTKGSSPSSARARCASPRTCSSAPLPVRWLRSSSRVPWATRRPRWMTRARSQVASTSGRMCVERSKV